MKGGAEHLISVSTINPQHPGAHYHTFIVKCESPSNRENIIINGHVSPALENAQISLSCPPGYGFPDREATTITSTCTNEAVWYPNISLLQCQGKYGIVTFNNNIIISAII